MNPPSRRTVAWCNTAPRATAPRVTALRVTARYATVARGFTLIELLVVIAIIAILASILFPVFARARENARRASCQSNMKQIGLGIMQYTQDYDEMMPYVCYGPSESDCLSWRDVIHPYIKSGQIQICPSASDVIGWTPQTTRYDCSGLPSSPAKSGYGLNNVHSAGGAPNPPVGQSLAAFVAPTETILLFDWSGAESANNTDAGSLITLAPTGSNTLNVRQDSTVGRRHLEGANYLWCDGHVKWMPPSKLAEPTPNGGNDNSVWTIE